jgi:hypothetical protein
MGPRFFKEDEFVSALTDTLDIPSMLENLVQASDRAKHTLEISKLSDTDRAELEEFISRTESQIEYYEDILDVQELTDATADVKDNGSVPWDQVKLELGL